MNKTMSSINLMLENYTVVRAGNEDYFVYSNDVNATQLDYDNLTNAQPLDLTQ